MPMEARLVHKRYIHGVMDGGLAVGSPITFSACYVILCIVRKRDQAAYGCLVPFACPELCSRHYDIYEDGVCSLFLL